MTQRETLPGWYSLQARRSWRISRSGENKGAQWYRRRLSSGGVGNSSSGVSGQGGKQSRISRGGSIEEGGQGYGRCRGSRTMGVREVGGWRLRVEGLVLIVGREQGDLFGW